jgi:hypothetical protein
MILAGNRWHASRTSAAAGTVAAPRSGSSTPRTTARGVSFTLASAGLLDAPTDSSGLARFGKPGKGKWVTIDTNAGHALMVVAGLRFGTVGRGGRARAGRRHRAR